MISAARFPYLSILAAAARARSRLGGSCASHSMQLLALVMAAAMGCLISCASDAAISPNVLTRLVCARSASSCRSFSLSCSADLSSVMSVESPHAREGVERLVKWADVFVINFPNPVRKRLQLTYEDIAPWNPRLIYADLTGYGDAGPDADLPGFDITAYWARSGLLAMTRDAGAPPTLPVP